MPNFRVLCAATLFSLLSLGAAAFVLDSIHAVRSSAEIDYGEGIVMWQAAHVTNWSVAYHSVDVYPHIVFHYTPVYHLVSRAVAVFIGNLLAAGRLVSVLSLTGVCVIFFLLTWRSLPPSVDSVDRFIAAVCSGLLIFTLPVWTWAVLMRVDTLAVLFSFSGMACFIAARNRPILVYCAFLFFILAVYTKQTMIAAPAACFVLLVLESPKRALRTGVLAVGLGLVPLALLQIATHNLFLRNIITYNRNPFIPNQLIKMWLDQLSASGLVLACALTLPMAFLFRARWRSLPAKLRLLLKNRFGRCLVVTSAVLVFALAMSVTVGKQGANYNYFLELDLVIVLASGLFIGWLLPNRGNAQFGRANTIFPLFAILLLVSHSFRTVRPFHDEVRSLLSPVQDDTREVRDIIAKSSGPVYSDDMVVMMLAKKEIPAEPAIITALVKNGQWDESKFVQRILNGEFSEIVVSIDLSNTTIFSPGVAGAIKQSYRLVRNVGTYKIYEPR